MSQHTTLHKIAYLARGAEVMAIVGDTSGILDVLGEIIQAADKALGEENASED